MTAPVRGTGGDRDDGYDGYDGYDDDWEPVLDEEVRGPLPPPPDTTAGVRCPGCAALVLPGTPRCPRCLARIGGGGGGGTAPPGARVVLHFDTLALSLPARPGEPLRLGRDTDWAPASSGAFAELTTVSRRHASVTVDPDGSVWVTEESDGTVNGTWVNGAHLLPGARHRLRHGDRLQLGHRVACTVRITGDGPC
ncbi:FHA domain-containing protein [Streptomyces sp. Wh19]|uniref:FHA domain-containing protein n=1 Tax=Streptomyces sp. Wh19 TaxID=3076629 RepID=UPI002958C21B|nr:FHA domain-containing protein [Streptomyces sp. Wh19]MDV9200831.1 FHA domain-containing protein [Streptomyces sp. Wh19]